MIHVIWVGANYMYIGQPGAILKKSLSNNLVEMRTATW